MSESGVRQEQGGRAKKRQMTVPPAAGGAEPEGGFLRSRSRLSGPHSMALVNMFMVNLPCAEHYPRHSSAQNRPKTIPITQERLAQ